MKHTPDDPEKEIAALRAQVESHKFSIERLSALLNMFVNFADNVQAYGAMKHATDFAKLSYIRGLAREALSATEVEK